MKKIIFTPSRVDMYENKFFGVGLTFLFIYFFNIYPIKLSKITL